MTHRAGDGARRARPRLGVAGAVALLVPPLLMLLIRSPGFAQAPTVASPGGGPSAAIAPAPSTLPSVPAPAGAPVVTTTPAPTPGSQGQPVGAPVAAGPVLTGRLGEGQATIVGGNVASARERALTEAFKHAVDAAIDSLGLGLGLGPGLVVSPPGASAGPDIRTTQPKLVVQVLGRARAFVRRYRTLDEGERAPGTYSVRIDAEVDDGALRRALEKSPGPGVAPAGSALPASSLAGAPPTYFVVGTGGPEAVAAVAKALGATGARVRIGTAADGDLPERALEVAARAQLGAVAFVSATSTSEGRVRGPGLESVSCSVALRMVQVGTGLPLQVGTGLPLSDETETARSFSDREETARADCLGRAAGAVAGRAAPQAGDTRGSSGLRTVAIDAEVVEPGAVLALLKQVRGLAPVSSVDLRSITAGHVELQVRSRLPGAALTALLTRDASVLDWSGAEVTGDLVRARVRLRSNEAEHVAPLEGGAEPAASAP